LATPEDLRGYLIFLETMFERFTKLKNWGRTVDKVVPAAPTKEFDEKLGGGFMKPEQFVRIAYPGLLKYQRVFGLFLHSLELFVQAHIVIAAAK
jgi:hypothetical protein